MISRLRGRRKVSGGLYRRIGKKLRNKGNTPTYTLLGKESKAIIKGKAGLIKQRLFKAEIANVYDPKAKRNEKLKILTIVENPANRHFVRRNIITKGAVIKTDKGNARVVSRPAQDGIINAVLI